MLHEPWPQQGVALVPSSQLPLKPLVSSQQSAATKQTRAANVMMAREKRMMTCSRT
ncbi:hypothetical protein BDU57DRAFT_517723 [Ampelomyces quisqualis]|uniref:Uncharacterized protein n=1 Tax=Ampelomyces quisqualis TaxID=50730 RepID=A0A6A5QR99_AMPQU|nr:hypothetical protein BDU57DRAFT_517723 [Ampelomyces quisqualis]